MSVRRAAPADICGVPPQRLVWWKSTRPDGATELRATDEFSALSDVFDQLMELASELPDGDTKADQAKGKAAAGAEKKKRRKKKKSDKSNSDDAAKPEDKTGAKPSKWYGLLVWLV